MARRKVSTVFYDPEDLKHQFRWQFIEVLAEEYRDKVIALEDLVPLYLRASERKYFVLDGPMPSLENPGPLRARASTSPSWNFTELSGWLIGYFEMEQHGGYKDILEPPDKNLPVNVFGEPVANGFNELVTGLRDWASEFRLGNTLWIYEVAVSLLEELPYKGSTTQRGRFGIEEPERQPDEPLHREPRELRNGLEPDELRDRIERGEVLSWIHAKANTYANTWRFPSEIFREIYTPGPPLPRFLPWMSEAEYREQAAGVVDDYIKLRKTAFQGLGLVELPDKPAFEEHCRWTAWRIVEGLSWEKIAKRARKTRRVEQEVVRRAIIGDSKRTPPQPGVARLCGFTALTLGVKELG